MTHRIAPPEPLISTTSAANDACGICGYWRCRCNGVTPAAAFTAVYVGQAARVRRVVLAELRLGDQAVADDMVQDVFLNLWRRLERGDQLRNPAGLLTVMARHRVIDHYRRSHVRYEVPTDTTVYGAFDRASVRDVRELVAA
jgi:DNA-directed RNA polymerase specialized sigma24 family protein